MSNKDIKFASCSCSITPGAFSINEIDLNCPAVWRLISSGHTVGVFQLEKKLGQDWSKKVKPDSIEELAALVSLLRPGPLEAGLSQDYVDVKFGRKKATYLHPALKPILESTKGQMVYQEQALRIATDIAGFSPEMADELRKAIGKKKPELMAKIKHKFVEGAQKHSSIAMGIAEEIFGWIEKCQRYSFNKCFSGDTVIQKLCNNQHDRTFTIREMYEIMHRNTLSGKELITGLRSNWIKQNHYGYGLSVFQDGLVRKNIIRNIKPSGKQQLYLITLENGYQIKTTIKHKFPTSKGEMELKDIVVGDKLYVSKREKWQSKSPTENRRISKAYQSSKLIEFKKRAYRCCWECGNMNNLEVHHINKNYNNNEWDNLRLLCISCHKNVHKNDTKYKPGDKGWKTELIRIATIDEDNIEDTWDVTMDDPYHNLVVNDGIIACNSHAVSYSMISYATAWLKCHFPHEFFTSYLTYSQYKGDPKEEIYKLVQDARFFGINIFPPDIRRGNIHFKMTEEPQKGVAFGLAHVRGVGTSAIEKIVTAASETSGEGSLETWCNFLSSVPDFHRNVGIALIKSGACDCYGMERSEMVRELEVILGTTVIDSTGKKVDVKGLTNKEKIYFFNQLEQKAMNTREILLQMAQPTGNKTKKICQMTKTELVIAAKGYLDQADIAFDGIVDGESKFVYTSTQEKKSWLETIGSRTKKKIEELMLENGYKDIAVKPPCSSDARRKTVGKKAVILENPITDTNTASATAEKHFLGIALSCSQADDADDTLATHTCLEVATSPNGESIIVCAIIDSVKHTKTKRGSNPGQPMCFLTMSDSTYSIDHAVVFPDTFDRLKAFCKDDLICLVYGQKKNGSFIIRDIQKLM